MPGITRLPTSHSYSAAVAAGDFVFLGLHRGFGEDFDTQLAGTIDHLTRTLAECRLVLGDLVKVHVYLKRIGDLPRMEQGFAGHFPDEAYPARMTTTTEFIDADCLLMIDGVAYRGS
ncbi:MAG TPA: RidA family protein [Nocardioidaceae bacterium]|nr:RidA family protein [Nocardioidaceae bacterium]